MIGVLVSPVAIAKGADETLPAELMALIGKKLPPVASGKARASFSNFELKGSFGAGDIGFEEGVYLRKWPVVLVTRIHKDMTTELLDVLMLPKKLIDWRYEGDGISTKSNKFIFVKNRFALSERCRTGEEDERMILGLVKPESGKSLCTHFSNHVKQAWMVGGENGKISPISPDGLQCMYLTMDDCF